MDSFVELVLAPLALIALFGVIMFGIPGVILSIAGAFWAMTGVKWFGVCVALWLIVKYAEVLVYE